VNRYVHWDNMTWPSLNDEDLEWKLRHTPGAINGSDLLVAASYIGAFRALVQRTQKQRNEICKKIKELSK